MNINRYDVLFLVQLCLWSISLGGAASSYAVYSVKLSDTACSDAVDDLRTLSIVCCGCAVYFGVSLLAYCMMFKRELLAQSEQPDTHED
jgi:hypothetical protein